MPGLTSSHAQIAIGKPNASRSGGSGNGCATPREDAPRRPPRKRAHRSCRRAPRPWAAAAGTAARKSRVEQQIGGAARARLVAGRLFHLLRLVERAVAIEAPERDFGMHLEHARAAAAASARRKPSTSRIFGASMNSCFETLRGGSEVSRARSGRPRDSRRQRAPPATAPRTPTIAARRAIGRTAFSAARPPWRARSGSPIGMSTAMTAGASGAAITSAKHGIDPHACFIVSRRVRRPRSSRLDRHQRRRAKCCSLLLVVCLGAIQSGTRRATTLQSSNYIWGITMTIRPRRSVLYMPGSNARASRRPARLPADARHPRPRGFGRAGRQGQRRASRSPMWSRPAGSARAKCSSASTASTRPGMRTT